MTFVRKLIIGTITLFAVSAHAEKAPQKVFDILETKIKPYSTDAKIIEAVKAENAKNKTLTSIKKQDEIWKSTAGYDDFMNNILKNGCSQHLNTIIKGVTYISEIFVMDNQGANVAMTDKTSDYWQGDEAKFTESFKGGIGANHVSEVEFDESTQTYSVQISIPVIDGGKAIGAITFGINVDEL